MTNGPFFAASGSTYEEFMEIYDKDYFIGYNPPTGYTAIFGAMGNHNPRDRVLIGERLLDDGADPCIIAPGDRVNVLHGLFGHRPWQFDFALEAPVLKRLLEGGADMNLRSPRFGTPIQMVSRIGVPEAQLVPFYDVIFSGPYVDMNAVTRPSTGRTVRDMLGALPPGRAELARRAHEYDKAHPDAGE